MAARHRGERANGVLNVPLLPGGLHRDGRRRRRLRTRPVDGRLELRLLELAEMRPGAPVSGLRMPDAVTEVLGLWGAAWDDDETATDDGRDAPRTFTPDDAADLSVADRQYLMRRLSFELGCGEAWLSPACPDCRERLDVRVDARELPIEPAGDGFPFTTARVGGRQRTLRAPTGRDQAAVLADVNALADPAPDAAVQMIAARCIVADDDGPAVDPASLDQDDVRAISEALEELGPELTVHVRTACPACGRELEVAVDPYIVLSVRAPAGFGRRGPAGLLDEVHALAVSYHWSEGDILDLPRARRHAYLDRVGRDRRVGVAV